MNECEFKEICPTTNYWVEEKKEFIREVCNTREHKCCIQQQDFVNQKLTKNSEEWKKIVEYFKLRKQQYPPYGIIDYGIIEVEVKR